MAKSRSDFEPIKNGWLDACLDGEGGGYDKIHLQSGNPLARPLIGEGWSNRSRFFR